MNRIGPYLLLGNKKILNFLLPILLVYALPLFAQTGNISQLFKTNGTVRGIAIDHERDRIYLGSCDHYLYCIDLSGRLQWKYNTGSDVHRVGYDRERGQIYCRSKQCHYLSCISSEGDLLWEYHTGNGHGIDVDRYTHDIYFATHGSRAVHCFSAEGNLKWKNQISTQGTMGGLALDPERDSIYVGISDGFLYSLDYQGRVNWKVSLGRTDSIAVDPGTGYVYCASWNGYLYCVDPDGSRLWRSHTGNLNSGITLDSARGKVYCAVKDDGICCLSLEGWIVGRYRTKNIEMWASIQVDSHTGDLYFGSTDGWLYRIGALDHLEQSLEHQHTVIQELEERIQALEYVVGPSPSP